MHHVGIQPSNWKIAKVITQHKAGKPKDLVGNCRSNSPTSCVSKPLIKLQNTTTNLKNNKMAAKKKKQIKKKKKWRQKKKKKKKKYKSTNDNLSKLFETINYGFHKVHRTTYIFFLCQENLRPSYIWWVSV